MICASAFRHLGKSTSNTTLNVKCLNAVSVNGPHSETYTTLNLTWIRLKRQRLLDAVNLDIKYIFITFQRQHESLFAAGTAESLSMTAQCLAARHINRRGNGKTGLLTSSPIGQWGRTYKSKLPSLILT